MLSVGRELKIHDKGVFCRTCFWQGAGAELVAGLLKITSTPIYSYVYRCPQCLSFDLTIPGKVLPFLSREAIAEDDEQGSSVKSQQAMP
jgi:hypothetical protein